MLVNCASLPVIDSKESSGTEVRVSASKTAAISVQSDSAPSKVDPPDALHQIDVPVDLPASIDIVSESTEAAQTRVKRIHLFRPLFVYRQQQVKKQRLEANSRRLDNWNRYRASQNRNYATRNRYYQPESVRPAAHGYDAIDRYPYDRNYGYVKPRTRRPQAYSGNEDYYQGQRFLSENQRGYSRQDRHDRPIYERRQSSPDYYEPRKQYEDGASARYHDSGHFDPRYYDARFRP